MKRIFFLLATGVFMVFGCGGCSTGYQGPESDHFDGARFFIEGGEHSFGEMVKWLWEMETIDWPEWIEDPIQPPPPDRVGPGDLRITYVNHATVLIQMEGIAILTDPIWSERAGPFSWMGVKRVRKPGVALEQLPKVDLILISHDHYDHLDLPTLKTITRRDRPVVLTGLGLKRYLAKHGVQTVHELDWWQSFERESGKHTVTFVPAQHNSGRWPLQANKTLWGGYVISTPQGAIYFAGDTGYGPFMDRIAERFGEFRLTLLPIGSYEKRWFMQNQHLNPEDAVKVHLLLKSQQSAGLHYGTFAEHPEQAIDAHESDLSQALARHGLEPSAFWVLKFGEGRDVGK